MSDGKKPNILFAIADDASHFGVYGHDFVKTPNIDALAKKGVRFNRAYTTNPKCAPSRASILTGMHTWQLREGCDHFSYFPDDFEVYPDLLESSGYKSAFTGKGWAPGNYRRSGRTRNPAGTEYNKNRLQPPEGSLINACDYAANFAEFLSQKKDEQPFCFWYGGHEPHRPYAYGEGLGSDLKPQDMKVPPYWPDEESVRVDIADYAYEIGWFDTQLGRIIAELEKRGLSDSTWIVITSDNGAPFPRVKGQMYEDDFNLPLIVVPPGGLKQGKVVDDLISFTDFFPTFLEIAQLPVAASCAGRSFVSLCQSGESTASEREYVLMGREKHDLGSEGDKAYPVRCLRDKDYLYVWNLKPELFPAGNPETGFTNCDSSPTKDRILELHDKGNDFYYNLSFGKRPREELYHIPSDPFCMKNLVSDTTLTERLARYRKTLQRDLRLCGDPRMFGQGDEFDLFTYIGDDRHSWKALTEGRWQKQPF